MEMSEIYWINKDAWLCVCAVGLVQYLTTYRLEQIAGPQLTRTQTSPTEAVNQVTAQSLPSVRCLGVFLAASS